MAFFVSEGELLKNEKEPKRTRTGSRAAVKENRALDPTRRGCDNCSLKSQWPVILTRQMKMCVPYEGKPDILFLGEGPGEQEDHQGVPFVGKSGQFLRSCFSERYLDRIAWQNAVRCRPPDNRNPSPLELHACSQYLDEDIAALKPKAIVGIGGVPLSKFISGPKQPTITDIHGIKFPVEVAGHRCWYYPVLHPSYLIRMGGDESPAYPVFVNDLKRFFQTVDHWPKRPTIYELKPEHVTCAYTEEEARKITSKLYGTVAVDIETPGLKPFKHGGKILTAAVSDGIETVAWPIHHPEAPNDWGWKLLDEIITTKQWIAHNAAFELLWFWYNKGLDWVPGEFADTMALGRIYHERHNILSLSALTRIHLGQDVKSITDINLERVAEYPLSTVLPYNGLDALATIGLYYTLENHCDEWQVNKILGSIKSTTRMEFEGLPADRDEAQLLHDRFDGIRQKAVAQAKDLYEVRQFELKYQEHFNIGSGEHVGKALVEFGMVQMPMTEKKKVAKTDEETLSKVDNPLASLVLSYREAGKLCSTYLEGVISGDLIAPDGLLHPGYTTMFTRTLRLSSEGPNIQNFPKRKHREIRRYIKAPPGYILVAFDYGQLEARVIACASKDKWLCESILTGYDIHGDWRDRLLKLYPDYMLRIREKSGETSEKELLKAGRNNIKNDFVFASFFGSSVKNCADNTDVPYRYMQELAEDFWHTFSGVKRWIKAKRGEYKATGSVETLTGRRRYGVMMGNEPLNTPIQGTAADVVQMAQNELCELSMAEREPFLMPRINVHDDLTFIMPDDDELEGRIRRVAEVMVKRRFPWMIVPMMVEANVGYNWADLTEICKITGAHYE